MRSEVAARGRREAVLGHHRDDVEVRPPQRAGDADGQERREHDAAVELDALRAHADRHDRLPEGDDHDQAEALGEVLRVHVPALGADGEHDPVVEDQREHPQRVARRAVEGRAGEDDEPGARDERGDERQHGAAQRRVAAGGEGEQRGVQDADREVAEAPQHAVLGERPRRGQRDDEHGGHRREHHEPRQHELGVDRARQPGVARPGPPDDREDDEAAPELRERRVRGHERRDLREREDEDQVEEQLERRDRRVARVRPHEAPGTRRRPLRVERGGLGHASAGAGGSRNGRIIGSIQSTRSMTPAPGGT